MNRHTVATQEALRSDETSDSAKKSRPNANELRSCQKWCAGHVQEDTLKVSEKEKDLEGRSPQTQCVYPKTWRVELTP